MSFIYSKPKRMSKSNILYKKKNIRISQKQIVFYEGFFKPHYGPHLAFLDSSESVFTLIPFITGMAHEATG